MKTLKEGDIIENKFNSLMKQRILEILPYNASLEEFNVFVCESIQNPEFIYNHSKKHIDKVWKKSN